MPHTNPSSRMGPYPFAALDRSTDRDRLLVQVVAAVWDSILGFPILPRDQVDPQDFVSIQAPALAGDVRISGEWNGAVVMCVPFSLASDCAAVMYGKPAGGLTGMEVEDAWGELVNMVGGGLKGLLPPPTRLSLPRVGNITAAALAEQATKPINTLTFACLGRRMQVTVLRQLG